MAATAVRSVARRSIERVVLDNGVKVWTERVPRSGSVAIGVWIDAGSRYEDVNESGSTHLMQRAAFHGTQTRSAAKIAREIKTLGGDVSITTERDHAGYLAQVDPADAEKALDLVADLALRPKLDRSAISAEQKKILEELRAAESDPDSTLESMFLRSIWMGRGLCRPPRGRLLTFRGDTKLYDFKPKSLLRLHRESHHPSAITVTMSGNLEHAASLELAEKLFGSLAKPDKTATTLATVSYRFLALRTRPQFSGIRMMLGVPACGASDTSRHAAGLLNALLGGGACSRLTARSQENGSAKQRAGSELMMFADAGVLTVRLQAPSQQAAELLEKTVAELRSLTTQSVAGEELETARSAQASARQSVLGSATERIRDMARQERYFAGVVDPDEETNGAEKVTAEHIRQLAAAWITPQALSLAAIGELNGAAITPDLLRW